MSQTLLASVVSSPTEQPDQKHRSSGNFSTDSMPSDTSYLLFTVTASGSDNPNLIHFDVMQDVSAGHDGTPYPKMYNNSQSDNVKTYRSLYIANPTGATQDFTVSVYAVS